MTPDPTPAPPPRPTPEPYAPLAAELADLLNRVDPVPEAVLAAARDSWSWRDPDAALARLVAETGAGLASSVRGPTTRLLTFAHDETTVDIEIGTGTREVRIVGQLAPPSPGTVHIVHSGGRLQVAADELGRFRADGVRSGPVRLSWHRASPPGAPPVHTEWFLV